MSFFQNLYGIIPHYQSNFAMKGNALKMEIDRFGRAIWFLTKQLQVIILFAFLYWLVNRIETIRPFHELDFLFSNNVVNSTAKNNNPNYEPWTLMDCFYFSLVTQTTVGYGDINTHTTLTKLLNILQLFSIYGLFALSMS